MSTRAYLTERLQDPELPDNTRQALEEALASQAGEFHDDKIGLRRTKALVRRFSSFMRNVDWAAVGERIFWGILSIAVCILLFIACKAIVKSQEFEPLPAKIKQTGNTFVIPAGLKGRQAEPDNVCAHLDGHDNFRASSWGVGSVTIVPSTGDQKVVCEYENPE